MDRQIRISLYLLSMLAVVSVVIAILASREEHASAASSDAVSEAPETVLSDIVSGTSETVSGDMTSEILLVTSSDAAPETETEEAEEPAEAVTLLFTGDVLFANAFKAGYDANGIEGVIDAALLEELNAADILMINNEFPFSDRGLPMVDKQYTFRCSPSYVTALNEMGVDVVSLANNHTLDYGKEALEDTFATLEDAGILYGGAGDTVERAEEIQIIEAGGRSFGFIAVSRVIPTIDWKVEYSLPGLFSCYDDTRLLELIAEAREDCDFVVVYPHWGVEYEAYPEDYQVRFAQRWVEAGADLIVGCHTHCLQGASFIEGKPVFYSLGNFVFGRNIDRSAVLKVTVQPDGTAEYVFLPVYASGGVTRLAEENRAEEICRYLDRISRGTTVESDGRILPE